MPFMRAKFQVTGVTQYPPEKPTSESIAAIAVTGKAPFGPNGESEDNTYARYSPAGSLTLTFNNPALLGQVKAGDKFYLDFTKADE